MKEICCIFAHPDDEMYGVGGTLLKHQLQNDNINLIMTTNGDRGDGSGRIRIKEMEIVHDLLTANKTKILDSRAQHPEEHREIIFHGIREHLAKNTNIIYTHSPWDTHPDHRITSEAASHCCRNNKMEIRYFESLPYYYNTFVPNLYVDISAVIDDKLKILNLYRSELVDDTPLSVKGVKRLNSYRGLQCGTEYAEAFFVARKVC